MTMLRQAAVLAALAIVLVGCGSSDDSAGGASDAGSVASAAGLDDSGAAVNDACGVLSDDQVTDAIGDHAKPEQDYVFGGCYWPSSKAAEDPGTGWGLRLAVNLTAEMVTAIDHDPGEPVDGLGPDATYDVTSGELWFTCGDQLRCVAVVTVDSPEQSEQNAIAVAKEVQQRLS